MKKILRRYRPLIPAIVICITVITIIFIPLRVIAYGYLPLDDALRHAAKVISGKDWSQILVVRDEIKMDSHPGWHAVLGCAHRLFGLDQDGLVVFSVVALFILFCLVPIFFLKRPEVWPIALLIVTVANNGFMMRLFFGRPYIISMAVIAMLCLRWQSFKVKKFPYTDVILLALLISASTWMHCSWHLWAVPVFAFFLAREYRAAFRIVIACLAGILIGASFTGHPAVFLKQSFAHSLLAFSGNPLHRMLVSEFQPFGGDMIMVIVAAGLLILRYSRGAWNAKCVDNPVFILAATEWVLAFFVMRFWIDWGMPALMVWIALELQGFFKDLVREYSWRRILITSFGCLALFLALTNDLGGRWTYNLTTEYLSQDDPRQEKWLPDAGGIVYSNDMAVFYQTFFKNPKAPWRYILGFEPAWMPPDDLRIYRKIQWNYGASQSFEPWVKKMRPQDRMIIRGQSESAPKIEGLEWYYTATNTWIGRLPKK